MREDYVANGKGAWTGCGILFVRRLGGNSEASTILDDFTTGSR